MLFLHNASSIYPSISKASCRCFYIRYVYIQFLPFLCISNIFYFILPWVPHLARAPRWYLVTGASGISHYSKIKYGESKDNIKTRQNFRKCFSGTFSPEELREGSWLYRFLRWYRKCCCLSIFDASSAFSVLFLAKFCTPWYLRSSELRRIQRNIYRKSHLVHLIIP